MFLLCVTLPFRGRFGKCVCFVRSCASKMNCELRSTYEEAVYALNGLQSNVTTLQKAKQERDVNAFRNLVDTEKHLKTLGIHADDLDSLNIIHISGTKGKGSTCAFTESIIRKHGYKTGFYSSPHLVSVNERIRLNGLPLNKDLFAKYFWEVYNPIQHSLGMPRNGTHSIKETTPCLTLGTRQSGLYASADGENMPPYFMFLTILAFYIFMKEKVQAAIVEVGVGGLYDCTNVIRNPVVVGVCSLGIDHVHILGNTLAEIAAQKAGIFKPGVPAFTVPQNEVAMKVLSKTAQKIGCSLQLAPPLEFYEKKISLGVPGIVQKINASLAVQLSGTWLKNKGESRNLLEASNCNNDRSSECGSLSTAPLTMAVPYNISVKFLEALKACVWPGRFQTVKKRGLTFYLDGAHTQQSMKYCVKWFEDVCEIQKADFQSNSNSSVLRVLLFNCTGERKAESLLDPLSEMNFDLVIFSPNRKAVMKDSASDQSNFMVDPEKEMNQCITNKEIWCHLKRSMYENELSIASQSSASLVLASDCKTQLHDNTLLFCCLSNAINWLLHRNHANDCYSCSQSSKFTYMLQEAKHIQILVTGSLHLVGGVLALISS